MGYGQGGIIMNSSKVANKYVITHYGGYFEFDTAHYFNIFNSTYLYQRPLKSGYTFAVVYGVLLL
jgi:hypothetical protein